MSSRNKWLLAAAISAVIVVLILFARPRITPSGSDPSDAEASAPTVTPVEGAAAGTRGAPPPLVREPVWVADPPAYPTAPGVGPGTGIEPTAGRPTGPTAGAGGRAPAPSLGLHAPEPKQPPPSYRPASVLRYSEALPASSRQGDDASPVVARIFEVTEATAEQRDRIRDLWHAHEDGRRALVAAAPPRTSGPVILDRSQLGPLDFAFESAMFSGVLNPPQRDRLALEVYPRPLPHK